MEPTENPIICLNYCVQDLETGYCLSCGRPPIPVTSVDLSPKTFAGISLKGVGIAANRTKTPDETS